MFSNLQINLIRAKRVLSLFALLFFILKAESQTNLILNPSFEDSTGIPTTFYQINKCNNWYPAFATPDYFSVYSPNVNIGINCSMGIPNNCLGYRQAKQGNFYTGIINRTGLQNAGYPAFSNYFEMLGNKLTQTLQKDHIYNFNLFYGLANFSHLLNNQLSAYFSANQYTINAGLFNPLDQSWFDTTINCINPQINYDTTQYLSSDTTGWHSLSGCFISNGSEKYVTIGNFRDAKFNKTTALMPNFVTPCTPEVNSKYCYLYIDDLSLYDIGYYSGKANCKNDTTICFNTSIVIGNNIKDSSSVIWQPQASLSCTNCPNPIASPSTTTKYYITKTLCSFTSKDSITISVFKPSVYANAGTDKQLCFNENAVLGTNDSTRFTTYSWQPNKFLNCVNCSTPTTFPNTEAIVSYTLFKTECGITSKDSVKVISKDCETTFILPNIFTPNGDGANDVWRFTMPYGTKLNAVYVYNRWGALIYSIDEAILNSNNSKIKTVYWDGHTTSGEECADGVYFYIVSVTENNEKKTFKGNVTLIR